MIIDSHFHIWQLARNDYGWLTPALAPIYHDVAIDDWISQSSPHGVTHGILVQAAPTLAETHFLCDQAARYPQQILGVVGWVDLSAADAIQQLANIAQRPQIRAIRPMLQDIADPDWILQTTVLNALATLPHLNLSFDALVKPIHLTRIIALAKQLPELRIIIDHGAKPDMPANAFSEWAQMMACLSEYPNVWCKLSGLLNESGTPPSLAACTPYIQQILTCFEGRTLWGSDWPVLALAGNYAQWVKHCKTMIAQHHADAHSVFYQAACDAYDLSPRSSI
jgi:L-fuconolactonase